MSTKVLLINFTEKETEKLKSLPLIFDRGFLSDISDIPTAETNHYKNYEPEDIDDIADIDFFFPHPVYEYQAIFINLNKNTNLEEEFSGKVKKLSKDDRKDFIRFWYTHRKTIIIFLGDYKMDKLRDVGIPDINLIDVKNEDVEIKSSNSEENNSVDYLCNEIKSIIKMPTNKYIKIKEKGIFVNNSEYKPHYLFWNNNSDDLGIYIDYDSGYSKTDRPRIIIFPQFRDNTFVIDKTLRLFGKLYPKSFSELPSSDWIDSDEYYPSVVSTYDKRIEDVISDAQNKIKDLKEAKKNEKEKYQYLRGLLTETGDKLKNNVLEVLSGIFNLSATDSDANNGNLPNEDIVIDYGDIKILAEVKGVKSQNPSPLFIGQVWKHISQSKDRSISKGALIVNHDKETAPCDRCTPYKGEHEKGLEDIIFIDTRVLFDLALAVIDYNMSPNDASAILLKDGRVLFDLEKYIKSKND